MWVTKAQCFKFTGSPIGEKTLLGGRDGGLMKPIASNQNQNAQFSFPVILVPVRFSQSANFC
jgi:hypothetical protein